MGQYPIKLFKEFYDIYFDQTMNSKFVSQIQRAEQTIFGITQKRELFFDVFPIAKIPKNIDDEKLMLSLKNDAELNRLVDEYFKAKQMAQELEKKEKSLSRQIDLEILNALILDIKMFNSDVFCDGIVKEEVRDQVIYRGKNFVLSTTTKDVDFVCFVKKVDEEIVKIDPNVLLEINHDERSIGIFYNHYLVYNTPSFKLNAVLSLFQDMIFLGELQQIIGKFRELYDVIDKQTEQVRLYQKIRKHVLETIKELSQG